MNKKENLSVIAISDAIVCDLDGTLYLENRPLKGAVAFLQQIINSGRRLLYFTNNTSKSRSTYISKLQDLKFPVQDNMLITAADCTKSYLKRKHLFPHIYLIGNRDLKSDFEHDGFLCLEKTHIEKGGKPSAVVLGFDTELTYEKIQTGYDLIMADLPYVATHADILCPVAGHQFIPDLGCLISLFETATGGRRPIVIGKPNLPAVEAICERTNSPPEKIAFIGDRLYTDIRMAQRFNMIGVLVLSGETSEEMLRNSPDQPQIVVHSVADLTPFL